MRRSGTRAAGERAARRACWPCCRVLAYAPAWASGRLLGPGDGAALHFPLRARGVGGLPARRAARLEPGDLPGHAAAGRLPPGRAPPADGRCWPCCPPSRPSRCWCCSRWRPRPALRLPVRAPAGRRARSAPTSPACASRSAPTWSATWATRPRWWRRRCCRCCCSRAEALHRARAGARAAGLAAWRWRCCSWPARRRRRAPAGALLAGRGWSWPRSSPGRAGRACARRAGPGRGGRRAAGRARSSLPAAPGRARGGTAADRPRRAPRRPAARAHRPRPALRLAHAGARAGPGRAAPARLSRCRCGCWARRWSSRLACSGDAARSPRPARWPSSSTSRCAMLAGLSLSAQWRRAARAAGPAPARAGSCSRRLASAAALSVAAAALGPLPQALAGAVGVLALALDPLLLAGRRRPTACSAAHLAAAPHRLLPAAAARARAPGTDAPTRASSQRGHGHAPGASTARWAPRRREPSARAGARVAARAAAADLGLRRTSARLAGRRSANGYDPMVPLRTRGGAGRHERGRHLPGAFFRTDPARLELLGVRWVEVPRAALRRGAGRGPEAPPRCRRSRAGPLLSASPCGRHARCASSPRWSDAVGVAQGRVVATLRVRLASGREFALPVRAGVETAEWAYDRPDVREAAAHQRPDPPKLAGAGRRLLGPPLRAELALPGRYFVDGVRLDAGAGPVRAARAAPGPGGRGRRAAYAAASPARAYVSDAGRFREVAATPAVRLFEVPAHTGPGPGGGAPARLARRRSGARWPWPARPPCGVDPRREALVAGARRHRPGPGGARPAGPGRARPPRRRRRSRCARRGRACWWWPRAGTRAGRAAWTGARPACSA